MQGATLKLKKCNLFTGTIVYIGQFVRPRRPAIGTYTIGAIEKLKASTNITKLHSYLGLCNVFHRFVHNFARIAAPLHQKLRKDHPKNFGVLLAEKLRAATGEYPQRL